MGWLSSLFARRYLLSKKSHSIINIISRVSSFAIAVPVAAMVILLSVFNGFEDIVKQIYTDFDPDITIEAAEGKVFGMDSVDRQAIFQTGVVEQLSQVMEDNALLEYRGKQYIATIRGVDQHYHNVVPIERMIVKGKYQLKHGDYMQAVIGQGVAYALGVSTGLLDPINVLVPKRGSFSTLLPIDNYRQKVIFAEGVFQLDAETDQKYVIVPIEFARELMDYPGAVTTIMVKLKEKVNQNRAQEQIAKVLGDDYRVLTRYQQKASLYKIMMYEKWAIFVIILMVLIIASFSIVGSLVMLIIEKKEDIKVIFTMGASVEFVRRVFVKEGMLISMIGAGAGVLFGLLFCWTQATFGFIKIPADTFLVDSYPIVVKPLDVAVVMVSIVVVTYVITMFTVRKSIKKEEIRLSGR